MGHAVPAASRISAVLKLRVQQHCFKSFNIHQDETPLQFRAKCDKVVQLVFSSYIYARTIEGLYD
jgi:hypothetical protein